MRYLPYVSIALLTVLASLLVAFAIMAGPALEAQASHGGILGGSDCLQRESALLEKMSGSVEAYQLGEKEIGLQRALDGFALAGYRCEWDKADPTQLVCRDAKLKR